MPKYVKTDLSGRILKVIDGIYPELLEIQTYHLLPEDVVADNNLIGKYLKEGKIVEKK